MGKPGRSTRSQERERFWRRMIADHPGSGMSVLAWCDEHGVSAPSFYVWRRKLAQPDSRRESRRPSLLPVEILSLAADESHTSLEIELPSQARVRVRPGCDLELLRLVLAMLQPDQPEADGC